MVPTLVNRVRAQDLAKLMMTVPPVQDAKVVYAFWVVIPRMTALITSFATANSVFLDALLMINVLLEPSAETTSVKLVAKITATVSLELFVLTASVMLVVPKLLTVLSPDNSAATVSAISSDAKITLIV